MYAPVYATHATCGFDEINHKFPLSSNVVDLVNMSCFVVPLNSSKFVDKIVADCVF